MTDKNYILEKININDFNDLKNFEYFFLNKVKYLGSLPKSLDKGIVLFIESQDELIYEYFKNTLSILIIKIDKYLFKKNIILKFINFPFCLSNNKLFIEKYFINELFLNKIFVVPKDSECYKCEYYLNCPGSSDKLFVKPFFKSESLISRKNVIKKIKSVLNFLRIIGIKKNDVYFDFLFDFNFDFINKKNFGKIELFIDGSKNNDYLNIFLNKRGIIDNVTSNLFFKNYIFQKKFNLLLKKIETSFFISYTDFDISEYKLYGHEIKIYDDIKYGFFRKKNISLYFREPIIFKKKISFGENIKGRSRYSNLGGNILLKVIFIKDIKNIKFNFSDYVVLFYNHDLNFHIPYIYKFKYFISFNQLEELAHYSIIFKEIGGNLIDGIGTGFFYGLKNYDILDVNFNTGIIKKIG